MTHRAVPDTKPIAGELIFEFIHLGNSVKVIAVDPRSGTEVSIVGDPAMGEITLCRAAARRLAYVLKRRLAPEAVVRRRAR